jgi:hypothetical protein
MTAKRLRPAHDAATLAELYAKPHDHTAWADHVTRVEATVEEGRRLVDAFGDVVTAADLSCGDAAIMERLGFGFGELGDLAPGYQYVGPIEQTIEALAPVDLFVCCETLEHLDDPAAVLRQIRAKTRLLLLSTPVDAWDDDNVEHYWAWSVSDVTGLLNDAGFTTDQFRLVDGPVYRFGIWGAR